MKKILSILLVITCILCVTSCNDSLDPSEAKTFDEIAAVLEREAETYRLCDEAEITKNEDFFTGNYNNYTDAIYAMCFAKMPDGTYIRVFDMNYAVDAELFEKSYGANYDYIYRNDTIVIFGTSPFIEEFKG